MPKFVKVLWNDNTSSDVTLETHVKALTDQILEYDKVKAELEKQIARNPVVAGVAKFRNGNICFAADGTCQSTFFSPHRQILNGRYKVTT